jgi:hypothetical protein
MDLKLNFPGVDPDLREDQIAVTQDANRLGLHGSFAQYAIGTNPNFKISGCVVTVGGAAPSNTWSMTAGYIFLNGEVIKADAQSGAFDSSTQVLAFSKQTTYDVRGDKTYQDGSPRQTWQINRAIITVKSSATTSELDAINGDDVAEKIRLYIGQATTTQLGFVEKATETEVIAGTADKYIDPALLKTYKTVEKGRISIPQNGSEYSITTAYDVFYFTSNTPPVINMPDPTLFKNRTITIYHNVAPANQVNISINNTGGGGSAVNDFYPIDGSVPGSNEGVGGAFLFFVSDGYRWTQLAVYKILQACPFIYVNGVYFDEILKNQVGIDNYREETIDITEVLKVGENTIKLTEEKKERTFIDYLILKVDGNEFVLFDERKVLEMGDVYEFPVIIEGEFIKATLTAKGYYDRL